MSKSISGVRTSEMYDGLYTYNAECIMEHSLFPS